MDVWRQSEETDLDKIASPHCFDEWRGEVTPHTGENTIFSGTCVLLTQRNVIKTGNRRTKMNLIILQVLPDWL
jgi:hypothetical protein